MVETCESSQDQRQARGAGTSIKPGVERSETPGLQTESNQARGARDSPNVVIRATKRLSPAFAGFSSLTPAILGFPLRSTPGFMLSPRFAGSTQVLNTCSELPKGSQIISVQEPADLTSSLDSAWACVHRPCCSLPKPRP